jgi:hypothetical protein
MKSNFFVSLAIVTAMSSVSFAQFSNSNTSTYKPEETVSGVKVSLLLPILTAKFDATITESSSGVSASGSDSESVDSLGFALGVASIPVQAIGFLGQVSFITIDGTDGAKNTDLMRLDANAAYGLNENVFLKGGLNYATFTSSDAKDFDGGLGLQLGVGVQLTQNVGLDLTYSRMNFEASASEGGLEADIDLQLSGLELGVSATF